MLGWMLQFVLEPGGSRLGAAAEVAR
jgi:hypothetical protein